MPRLKVYRTPIGFHDAYVAAPSQKAALRAWGSNVDLFARGQAEVVTDEALTREPLEHPGEVVRRARGTAAEHLAALPPDPPPPPRSEADRRPRRAPRPSRETLDAAERAIEAAAAEQDAALADLRRREAALAEERRALERRFDGDLARLRAEADRLRAEHDEALARWRG